MALSIRPIGTADGSEGPFSAGSSAFDLQGADVVLRFSIEISNARDLNALLLARRSMLREERTRGRDGEEPSLEEAVFSPGEISWRVRSVQRVWSLQKLRELIERATRYEAETPPS